MFDPRLVSGQEAVLTRPAICKTVNAKEFQSIKKTLPRASRSHLSPLSSERSSPSASRRLGAFESKYGFSAKDVTRVPWRASVPS